ncbi:MAG: glycosyltransferase [Kangiellaceae bacterium]|nr:glycosyltransferase [Kangiellaceae bacterium]
MPEVEVILIVRNVSSIIEAKLKNLLAIDYPMDKLKISIVSDQSSDDTVAIIKNFDSERVSCIENTYKSTKSACLNQAIKLSNAEILMMTDARQTHEPESLLHLVKHFKNPKVGAVSGELILLDPDTNEFSQGMDAYWQYEKFIRALESKIASVPGVTGAIYAMRRADFAKIPDQTLLDDVLIPMKMILNGKRVIFESQAIAFDIPSDDANREKIRKTRTLAGNWQLLELEPALLNPFKNKILFQFISHKVLRLISPLFLFLILLSSIALSGNHLFGFVAAIQVLGYSLVLLSRYIPILSRLPLVNIARSFLTLMWFTILGFWAFFSRNHLTIWK